LYAEGSTYELRAEFSMHPGDRIMLVDGLRTKDYPHLRALGRKILQQDARLIGTSTIFDVSGEGTMLGVRQISVARLERNVWEAADCPLCAAGKALDDPAQLGKSHI
jgi:orotate phosphoribosyltransferase